MKKHLILTLALTLPLSVGAFDPAHLKRLKETKECPKCDLSKADLYGAKLQWAYLEGANLTDADLKGANLKEANLDRANLKWANLEEAKFFSDNYGFK